jgi:hypothetical protein
MANGIMPTGAQLTEYQAITRRAFIPTMYVQIYQASPLLAGLMAHAKTASGGIPSITVPVQGSPMTIPQWMNGFSGQFNQPEYIPGIEPAEFNLKGLITPIPYYGMEAVVQDQHAVVPRIEALFNDATNSTADVLSNACWNNITDTQQITGLMAMADDGTNAATYGGINRYSSTFWAGKVYSAAGATPSRNNVLQYMVGVQKNSTEMPTMAIMGMGTWLALAQTFDTQTTYFIEPGRGFDSTPDRPRAGFRALDVGGVPVYCDPYCPEGIMLMLNLDYASLYFHHMANFTWTGFESLLPVYQLGYIGAILSFLELVCVKPRTQGRVGTVGSSGTLFTGVVPL